MNISAIPTVYVFTYGKPMDKVVGDNIVKLECLILEYQALVHSYGQYSTSLNTFTSTFLFGCWLNPKLTPPSKSSTTTTMTTTACKLHIINRLGRYVSSFVKKEIAEYAGVQAGEVWTALHRRLCEKDEDSDVLFRNSWMSILGELSSVWKFNLASQSQKSDKIVWWMMDVYILWGCQYIFGCRVSFWHARNNCWWRLLLSWKCHMS